jgi:hypothetical protein
MSVKLQQAIQAARAGDAKNAQFLLAQDIEENPENPHSWFLLSLLVDDPEQKKAYLDNVLALDPDHEKAKAQRAALTETAVTEEPAADQAETVAAVALSSGSSDLVAQDAGETLPDWMAGDIPPALDEEATVDEETAVTEETTNVPDWLQESVGDDWGEEKTETEKKTEAETEAETETETETEKPTAVKPAPKTPEKQKSGNEKTLDYLMIGLIVIAVIIFLVLAYMIYTTML